MRFCATVFPDFKIKRVKRRGPSGGMCGGGGGGGSTGGGASSAEVVQIDSLSMAAAVNEATSAAAAGSESGSRSSMSILRERCAELPQRSIGNPCARITPTMSRIFHADIPNRMI